ncbi:MULTISPECIES: Bug family tripartite tricarboxylate transporter substrate binding protein [Cupriavidus]
MRFRTTRAIVALASVAGLLQAAHAQPAPDYPVKPFRLIVPFPAGSGTDIAARGLAAQLSAQSGQPAYVENRPGASGFIAAEMAAHASPDGYALFVTTNTTHGANSALFRKLPYDPVKDFEPVSALASSGLVLVVPAASPYQDIGALVRDMGRPGASFKFGTGNSSSRIAGEMFRLRLRANALAVPYRGTPAAMSDLMANLLDFMFVDTGAALPLIRAGKLRALASTGAQRETLLREVPTLEESGLKDLRLTVWSAVFVPAGTPRAIVARLSEMVQAIAAGQPMQQLVAKTGGKSQGSSPEALHAFVLAEIGKWAATARAAGIEPE